MSKRKANQETAVMILKNQSLSQKAKKRGRININDVNQFISGLASNQRNNDEREDDDEREKDDGREDEKEREVFYKDT
ncbi:hypothetical protein RclHR1_20590002 [Rhizophagus clarus]|uniref:Uncharacterized protein n=1 Tax=Rhizophagus clarus TaxID=94130 RepID=A0A2Z6QTJ2_9GLOM|nr:hypothetical protein RclHR1_20590002 [Rhizophagus clarus]